MHRMVRIGLVLLLAIGASALVAFLINQGVLAPAKAREDAFDAIQRGQLSPGPDGVAALPAQWQKASLDGKAYVTRSLERTTWVFFLKEKGSGKKIAGYLFCDKPAKAVAEGVIEINYPAAGTKVGVKVVRVATAFSFEVVSVPGK